MTKAGIVRYFIPPVIIVAHALLLSAPAVAAANGNPNLDPSGGTTGTPYAFMVRRIVQSMDPDAGSGNRGTAEGTLTIYQEPNTGVFGATGAWDSDRNGSMNGTLNCTGEVGRRRFGLACSGETDGGETILFTITGQAKLNPDTGKVTMKKCSGNGFTETHLLKLVFAADQQ
jgi:hypothetical protein